MAFVGVKHTDCFREASVDVLRLLKLFNIYSIYTFTKYYNIVIIFKL